jgi:pyruvate dehydrogenase (quinone)
MPRKMQGTDFFQATRAKSCLFRDVSLLYRNRFLGAQAPAVIHQAIAAAYAGRGVAHLTLPVGRHRGQGGRSAFSSVATLKPRPELMASEDDIAEIARRIDQAGQRRDHVRRRMPWRRRSKLRALSDRLKAPLIHSVKGKDIMPYDDPRWMGGIGMIGTKPVYNAIMDCDLLADARVPTIRIPNSCLAKGLSSRSTSGRSVLGRRTPTAYSASLGSVRPTLKLLLDRVAAKRDDKLLGPGCGAAQVG